MTNNTESRVGSDTATPEVTTAHPVVASGQRGPRRRDVLVGAAGIGLGAAAAIGVGSAVRAAAGEPTFGTSRVVDTSPHQPGIGTAGAHGVFIAVDLAESVDRDRLIRLLRLLTDDALRLMAGQAPIGDQEPEMAEVPANLAITFGFGPRVVELADPAAMPEWLGPLPSFSIDQLEDRWSDGDLLMLVAGDDPLSVAHAQRMLLKDVRAFSTIRWQQTGFRNARGALKEGTTQRNLFGQIDGTANPQPGTAEFDRVVWTGAAHPSTGRGGAVPEWLVGGTSLVLRRIHMNLETWDEVDRPGREASVGRRLDTGAPLTGSAEHDEPDFEARTPQGFTVINPVSHMRRSRPDDPTQRIFRQTYNYDHPVAGVGGMGAEVSDSGLLFASYQANPATQFVPIQQRLADGDLLNTWTVPVGSAVFAIPPAAPPGGFIGEQLFQ
ncbi:Dyp-type peroxidase [Gulosibacter macacae]|uniref:Dyp-type peroxidase n=1 Tax=Gulosibacter macacae TaxID=2488791 RepID=UPI0038B37938